MFCSMTNPSVSARPIHAELRRFPRVRPDEVGIDAGGIRRFVEAASLLGAHSFMLVRHGKVAAEGWWRPYAADIPHTLYSLSKSFTSTAVGFAVAEGLFSTDDKVVSFFPDKLPADVSANLAAMRVYDLLTMSTGHETEPNVDGDADWVKAFLAHPVAHAPGAPFLYNTPATHMLAAIVEKRSGMSLTDYLRPRLYEPLGIEKHPWGTSPSGVTIGGYGLSLCTEDIAVFGQTYLQKGVWNGQQVIPADWVDLATRKQVSNGDPSTPNDWAQGYGFQFWRCRHNLYRGDGAFGQYCIVMPEYDAVLAMTSGSPEMGKQMALAWEHLLPAMKPAAPPRPDDDRALGQLLAGLQIATPPGQPTSPNAAQVHGKTFRLEPNQENITALTLTFSRNTCTLTLAGVGGNRSADSGYGEWIRGVSPFATGRRPPTLSTAWSSDPIAMSYAWSDPKTLTVSGCYYESPYVVTLTLTFEGDSVRVDRRFNVGFGKTELSALNGRI
jgi:CubicO group peptidase (beta-lactamase class C family)